MTLFERRSFVKVWDWEWGSWEVVAVVAVVVEVVDAVVEDAGVGSGGGASGLEEEGHETITMGDMHTCEKYNYLQQTWSSSHFLWLLWTKFYISGSGFYLCRFWLE